MDDTLYTIVRVSKHEQQRQALDYSEDVGVGVRPDGNDEPREFSPDQSETGGRSGENLITTAQRVRPRTTVVNGTHLGGGGGR